MQYYFIVSTEPFLLTDKCPLPLLLPPQKFLLFQSFQKELWKCCVISASKSSIIIINNHHHYHRPKNHHHHLHHQHRVFLSQQELTYVSPKVGETGEGWTTTVQKFCFKNNKNLLQKQQKFTLKTKKNCFSNNKGTEMFSKKGKILPKAKRHKLSLLFTSLTILTSE